MMFYHDFWVFLLEKIDHAATIGKFAMSCKGAAQVVREKKEVLVKKFSFVGTVPCGPYCKGAYTRIQNGKRHGWFHVGMKTSSHTIEPTVPEDIEERISRCKRISSKRFDHIPIPLYLRYGRTGRYENGLQEGFEWHLKESRGVCTLTITYYEKDEKIYSITLVCISIYGSEDGHATYAPRSIFELKDMEKGELGDEETLKEKSKKVKYDVRWCLNDDDVVYPEGEKKMPQFSQDRIDASKMNENMASWDVEGTKGGYMINKVDEVEEELPTKYMAWNLYRDDGSWDGSYRSEFSKFDMPIIQPHIPPIRQQAIVRPVPVGIPGIPTLPMMRGTIGQAKIQTMRQILANSFSEDEEMSEVESERSDDGSSPQRSPIRSRSPIRMRIPSPPRERDPRLIMPRALSPQSPRRDSRSGSDEETGRLASHFSPRGRDFDVIEDGTRSMVHFDEPSFPVMDRLNAIAFSSIRARNDRRSPIRRSPVESEDEDEEMPELSDMIALSREVEEGVRELIISSIASRVSEDEISSNEDEEGRGDEDDEKTMETQHLPRPRGPFEAYPYRH